MTNGGKGVRVLGNMEQDPTKRLLSDETTYQQKSVVHVKGEAVRPADITRALDKIYSDNCVASEPGQRLASSALEIELNEPQ